VNGAGLTIATAGIPAYFTIQSIDQYGNSPTVRIIKYQSELQPA